MESFEGNLENSNEDRRGRSNIGGGGGGGGGILIFKTVFPSKFAAVPFLRNSDPRIPKPPF